MIFIQFKISDLENRTSPSLGGFGWDIDFNSSVLAFKSIAFGDRNLGDLVDLSGFLNQQLTAVCD